MAERGGGAPYDLRVNPPQSARAREAEDDVRPPNLPAIAPPPMQQQAENNNGRDRINPDVAGEARAQAARRRSAASTGAPGQQAAGAAAATPLYPALPNDAVVNDEADEPHRNAPLGVMLDDNQRVPNLERNALYTQVPPGTETEGTIVPDIGLVYSPLRAMQQSPNGLPQCYLCLSPIEVGSLGYACCNDYRHGVHFPFCSNWPDRSALNSHPCGVCSRGPPRIRTQVSIMQITHYLFQDELLENQFHQLWTRLLH